MMAPGESPSGWFGGPLWVSGFRPFFLFGTAFGLIALGVTLPAVLGGPDLRGSGTAATVWHGHEMIFGFAAAIICGLLLTALPSWAGVPEQKGGGLAFFFFTWLAGRVAIWLTPLLAPSVVALADAALFVVLAAALAPGLLAARDKRFLVVLPVLLALAAANLAFHRQLAIGDLSGTMRASETAVAVVAILFSLTGGFMTPVFTRNAMVERGSSVGVRESRWVEIASHASVVAFALAVAFAAPARIVAGAAVAACIAHGLRLAGWRGFAVRGNALVFAMHVAYAWLVVAFAVAAAASLGLGVAPRAWIHPFTIGAIGTMMLALMPRVSLRHTGRALVLSRLVCATYPAMSFAALLRLAFTATDWGAWALGGAALLWALCFGVWLAVYGLFLVQPSLPRAAAPD